MNVLCSAEPCPVILNAICVHYEGGNLVYTGINTNDNLQVALEKINTTIENLIISGGGVTSVSVTAGTGISASVANPTSTPNITITNTAPDQTVVLNAGTGVSITGTYPNFTISATGALPNQAGNAGKFLTTNGTVASWATLPGTLVALPFTTDHLTVNGNPYVINDLVYYIGNVYRCIAGNDSIIPTNPSYWTNLGAGFPLVQQPGDWNSTSGNNQILNKPTIPTVTPSALSKVDDTNVTLTLGGTPNTALLQSVSLTLGWTGTLADSRIASAATWNAKQAAISLTTTGTSGAATFGSNILNIPQYQGQLTLTTTGTSGAATLSGNTLNIPQYSGGSGITSLNGETGTSQTFATGTTGTDFGIASASNVHTFNLPIASGTNTGKLSSGDWTTFNNKFNLPALTAGSVLFSNGTTIAQDNANFFWDDGNNRLGIGTATPSYKLDVISTGVYARFGEATGFNNLQIGTSTSSYVDLYGGAGERKLLIGNGGTGFADIVSYNTNVIRVGSSGTLPTKLTTFVPNFTFSAGTNTHTIIDLLPNINLTGGTNTLRGVYYHPNNTAGTPTTEIAWENTQGDIIHGNLSGVGDRMVVADSTGKLGTQAIPGGVSGSGTTNEIAYFTGATSIASLTTGTYPSLTELSYVKGVTSAIQTQLDSAIDWTPTIAYQAAGSVIKGMNVGIPQGVGGIATSVALADGAARFFLYYLPKAATITGVKWYQQTQGTYTAADYNGVGLYSYSAGALTLVASSTDDGNIWKGVSASVQSKAFATPYSAAAGLYVVAALYNNSAQTTAPAVGSNSVVNAALIGFDFTNSAKIASTLAAQTSLPASTTMAALTGNNTMIGFFLY